MMTYRITTEAGCLRGELTGRETVEETRAFLRALVREKSGYACSCVLILVRRSTPVFQVAAHRLIELIELLSGHPARRIALVGDTLDVHMSHEYIELLARQLGLNVRSYRNEELALQWLRSPRPGGERRYRPDQRLRDRRRTAERRCADRRRGEHLET